MGLSEKRAVSKHFLCADNKQSTRVKHVRINLNQIMTDFTSLHATLTLTHTHSS